MATPNASPPAEGSGDYNDTLMLIKSLKHRRVEPLSISASSEKICNLKLKPEMICNKPYCGASEVLTKRTAHINKETSPKFSGSCYEIERCYPSGNKINLVELHTETILRSHSDEFHKEVENK